MRVAVTGAAGDLGSCLLDRLAADPGVEAIVALDRKRLAPTSPNIA